MIAKISKNTKRKSIVNSPLPPLSAADIDARLAILGAPWRLQEGALQGEWRFADFNQIAALVRSVVRLSKKKNHHPQMEFGYRDCRLTYTTHAAGGLTELDFDCATRISALIARRRWTAS